MKTIIIGNLSKLGQIENKETYSSQNFEVTVQDYDQSTGEPKAPQVFPITVFNKKIKELNLIAFEGKRVRVTCWLRSIRKEHENKVFFNIALNATEIKEG